MYISSLRKFFNFLIEEEIIETKNLANSLKLSKVKDIKSIDIFTSDEIKKLIQYKRDFNIQYSKFLEIRDNLIINFLLETGCRNHEINSLKTEFI